MQFVVVDTEDKIKTLLGLKPEVPSLATVIVVEDVSDEVRGQAKEHGVEIVNFYDIVVSHVMI